jgi:hypothetical protein
VVSASLAHAVERCSSLLTIFALLVLTSVSLSLPLGVLGVRRWWREHLHYLGHLVGMQYGHLVHAQQGRMVGVMAEPGEIAFPGPLRPSTLSALETVNRTFPRFQIEGSGDGDTVPLALPPGSFIVNRNAAKALCSGRGF